MRPTFKELKIAEPAQRFNTMCVSSDGAWVLGTQGNTHDIINSDTGQAIGSTNRYPKAPAGTWIRLSNFGTDDGVTTISLQPTRKCPFCRIKIMWYAAHTGVITYFVPAEEKAPGVFQTHICSQWGEPISVKKEEKIGAASDVRKTVQEEIEKAMPVIMSVVKEIVPTDQAMKVMADGAAVELAGTINNLQANAKSFIQNIGNDVASKTMETVRADIAQTVQDEITKQLPQVHIITVRRVDGSEESFSGRPHKTLQKLITYLSTGLHVFLVGPAGGGKTTGGQQAAQALSRNYFEESMGPASSAWDLKGFKGVHGEYVMGLMREPYEFGGVLLLDEIDASNPAILTTINSALSNQWYTFPDKRVVRHPDFVCIAAGNTYGRGADRMYVGRQQLDAATLDRFVVIDWDYDEDAEIEWAGADMRTWTLYIHKVRQAASKLSMRVVVSPRASIFGAKLLRAGIPSHEVAESVLFKGINRADREKLIKEAGAVPTIRKPQKLELEEVGVVPAQGGADSLRLSRWSNDLDELFNK